MSVFQEQSLLLGIIVVLLLAILIVLIIFCARYCNQNDGDKK
jgi:uncharacterized membrane protein YqiK